MEKENTCANCGKEAVIDLESKFFGGCANCGCEVDGKELGRGTLFVREAIENGFTSNQAIWLHNQFYELKAI